MSDALLVKISLAEKRDDFADRILLQHFHQKYYSAWLHLPATHCVTADMLRPPFGHFRSFVRATDMYRLYERHAGQSAFYITMQFLFHSSPFLGTSRSPARLFDASRFSILTYAAAPGRP